MYMGRYTSACLYTKMYYSEIWVFNSICQGCRPRPSKGADSLVPYNSQHTSNNGQIMMFQPLADSPSCRACISYVSYKCWLEYVFEANHWMSSFTCGIRLLLCMNFAVMNNQS